ncbi:MAG: EVE domain-containing protein [bacterium]
MSTKYWLIKSEPDVYSIDNLAKDKVTQWDGIRNFQERNYLRDGMKVGDKVLFYHNSAYFLAVVGLCEVVKDGYPDPTAFNLNHKNFDPRSNPDDPSWYMVDIKFIQKFKKPVKLINLRANYKLLNMKMLERGNRLSIVPVKQEEFEEIVNMSL